MSSKPALHYKKLREINDWIFNSLLVPKSSLLCLSGPSGTGKRFVLQYLSAILGFSLKTILFPQFLLEGLYACNSNAIMEIGSFLESILSFSSSTSIDIGPPSEYSENENDFNGNSSVTTNIKQIFLIDDFPFNVEDAAFSLFSFLDCLSSSNQQKYTVILVYTEANFKEDRIFFDHCSKASCSVIKISPIPSSYIEKAIGAVFGRSYVKRKFIANGDILCKEVSNSSNGDIRMALNTFSFWSLLPELGDFEYISDRFFGSHRTLHHILAYLFFGVANSSDFMAPHLTKWQAFIKYCDSRKHVSSETLLNWVWENIPLFLHTDSIFFLHHILEAMSDCSFAIDCFQYSHEANLIAQTIFLLPMSLLLGERPEQCVLFFPKELSNFIAPRAFSYSFSIKVNQNHPRIGRTHSNLANNRRNDYHILSTV